MNTAKSIKNAEHIIRSRHIW